jgi:hypothetical protein
MVDVVNSCDFMLCPFTLICVADVFCLVLMAEMGLGKTIEILALILSTKKARGSARSQPSKVQERLQEAKGGLKAAQGTNPLKGGNDEQWTGEWGTTSENDTAQTIAAKCSKARGVKVLPSFIVHLNSLAFPSLTIKMRFRKGTSIRLREPDAAGVGDVSSRTRKQRIKEEDVHEGLGGGAPAPEAMLEDGPDASAAGLQHGAAGDGVVPLDAYGRVVAQGGTLIVVPVHLVSQWLCEIEKAAGSALSVTKYTADNKLFRRCALTAGGASLEAYAYNAFKCCAFLTNFTACRSQGVRWLGGRVPRAGGAHAHANPGAC